MSFSLAVAASSGSFPVARDFNNDGRLDLATITDDAADRNITVVLGNGDGTFRQPPLRTALGLGTPGASNAYPQSLSAGDFNRDGKLDLAVTIVRFDTFANEIRVLLGNGDGTFASTAPVPAAQGYWSVLAAVGDLNGDGTPDLVSTSTNDPWSFDSEILEVRFGRGDGTFTYSVPYYSDDADLDLYLPELADFNGDGRLDVAVPAINRNGSFVRVFPGNGNGSLQVPRDVFYPYRAPYPEPLVSGDFNGDGRADLVADSTVLLSNGDGTFRTAGAIGDGLLARDAGDIDGDGWLDLVAVNDQGGMTVLLGNGDGSFTPVIPAAGSSPELLADFNADQRTDVVVRNADGSLSVLLNDGNTSTSPTISVSDATVTEGNTGSVNAVFTVTLSRATNVDVTVRYDTANLTAAAGSDYVAGTGTLTIPAGQTSGTFTVSILGDRLAEPSETLAVHLSSPTNASLGDAHGVGTILDNEPRIRIANVSKSEGNKKTMSFSFTVSLTAAYDQAVTVNYATANGTATAGSDYQARSGSITFAPGETIKTITIIVTGDKAKESNEWFFVDLFGAGSNAWIDPSRGVGTILNDDR